MESVIPVPQNANIETPKFQEHVFIHHDATVFESQLDDCEEDPNSSNLFSSSSSLSEEMDISETEGNDHYSQLLAETENTQQPEKIPGIIMPTLTPKSRATSNGARLFNKIRRGTYDQYTPDVGDPYYFCRVCRIRSGSKSDYYEHLTAHHKMQLIPIEYWRPDHPDIIPAEFDNSNSCADCRIVFSVNLHYRNHLKEVHRIHLFNWSRAERQARVDAIFYPKESVLHFVKLSISPNQSVYRCFQCTKSVKVLRSIVKHYFNEHNTIAEICMLEDDGMNKENSEVAVTKSNNLRALKFIDTNVRLASARAKKSTTTIITLANWIDISCPTCQMTFTRRSFFMKHIFEVHHESNVRCGICDHDLADFTMATAHFHEKHQFALKRGDFSIVLDDYKNCFCSQCQKQYSSSSQYLHLINMAHLEGALSCGACNIVLKDTKEAPIHFLSCHNTQTQTRLPLKGSSDKIDAAEHQQSTDALPNHTTTGSKRRTVNSNADDFLLSLHDLSKKFCYLCQTTLSSKQSCLNHLYNIHRYRTVRCSTCNAVLNRSSSPYHICSQQQSTGTEDVGLNQHQYNNTSSASTQAPNDISTKDFLLDVSDFRLGHCYKCRKTFSALESYHDHIFDVHLKENMQCSRCSTLLKDKSEAQSHFSLCHGDESTTEIEQRAHETDDNAFLLAPSDWIDHFCYICKKKYASTEILALHIFSIHRKLKVRCTPCQVDLNGVKSTKEHLSASHLCNFSITLMDLNHCFCYKCHEKFNTVTCYIKHVFDTHGTASVKCGTCTLKLNDINLASIHLTAVHGIHMVNKPLVNVDTEDFMITSADWEKRFCYKCKILFGDTNIYRRHLFTYTHSKNTKRCGICETKLNDTSATTIHFSIPDCNALVTTSQQLDTDSVSNAIEEVATTTDDGMNESMEKSVSTPVEEEDTSLSAFTEMLMNASDSKCQICDTTFDSRYATLMHFLETHKDQSHGDGEEDVSGAHSEVDEGESNNLGDTSKNHPLRGKGSGTHPLLSVHRKRPRPFIRSSKRRLCKVCRKMFPTIGLAIHLATHEKSPTTTQTSTEIRSPTRKGSYQSKRTTLPAHITRNCILDQPTGPAFQCSTFKRTYRHQQAYEDHISKHCTPERQSSKSSVEPIQPKMYQCQYCAKKFENARGRATHITRMHGKVDDRHTKDSKVQRHRQLRSGAVDSYALPFQCSYCKESFKSLGTYKQHCNLKHALPSKPPTNSSFQCRVCSKKFISLRWYISHCKLKHATSPKICPLCDKKFPNLLHLISHYKNEHEKHKVTSASVDPTTRKRGKELLCSILMYCFICREDFKSLHAFTTHCSVTHANERSSSVVETFKNPIRCTVCSQSFPSYMLCRNHGLKAHQAMKIIYKPIKECDFDTEKKSLQLEETTGQEVANDDAIHDLLVGEKRRKPDDLDPQVAKKRKCNKSNSDADKSNPEEEAGSINQESSVAEIDKVKPPSPTTLDYVCNICQYSVTDRLLFRRHREREHRIAAIWDENEKYCNICQSEFKSKEIYRFHSEDVHNLLPSPS